MPKMCPEVRQPELLKSVEVSEKDQKKLEKDMEGLAEWLGEIEVVDTDGVEPFDIVKDLGLNK